MAVILVLILVVLTFILVRKSLTNHRKRIYSDKDIVVITGCDSGIGLALAKYLTSNYGFQVLACVLNFGQSSGYHQLIELQKTKTNLKITKLDVTNLKSIDDLIQHLRHLKSDGEIKNVVALINNAGVMYHGQFDWQTWRQIEEQVEVNLYGTLAVSRKLIPHLIQSQGRIINVTSASDEVLAPGLSVYSATKAAVAAFSRVLGFELRRFGVRVVRFRMGDFANLTDIMAKHQLNMDKMWDDMDDDRRKLYETEFKEYTQNINKNIGVFCPKSFDQSTMFDDFENAIFLENPPDTVISATPMLKVILFFFKFLPLSFLTRLHASDDISRPHELKEE